MTTNTKRLDTPSSEDKEWWEPIVREDGSLDWLCDHLGDAQEKMDRLWQELTKLRAASSETKPLKVYVVTCGWDYEGGDVKAILATREEAQAVCLEYENHEHFSYDSVEISEWEIGEITNKRWERPNV